MWVWSSGWNDDVMATPLVKSVSPAKVRAPRIASEFVRVSSPSRGETFGQVTLVAEAVQQLLGSHGPGCEHDVVGGEGRLGPTSASGAVGVDRPSLAVAAHRGHRRHRVDLGAGVLGQVQVVGQERVLGAVAAPGHALAALDAPPPTGTGATEERVVHLDAGLRRRTPRPESDGTCRPPPSPRPPPASPRRTARCAGTRRRRACAWPGRSDGASSARQSVMCPHCTSA